jgi:hypothetical protein
MSDITTEITIDVDDIITAVTESRDFDSAVNGVIENYDFSYDFDRQIEDHINNLEYIEPYDLPERMLAAIRTHDDIQHEIRLTISEAGPTQTTTTVQVPVELLEATAMLHKVCGFLSQQLATVNNLMGVSPWPTHTAEALYKVGALLDHLGYSVSDHTV